MMKIDFHVCRRRHLKIKSPHHVIHSYTTAIVARLLLVVSVRSTQSQQDAQKANRAARDDVA